MNAPHDRLSRAQQQALQAPFLIDDEKVVGDIARLADERGTPMAEIVKLAIEDYMQRHIAGSPTATWLQRYWDEHPLPLPTGFEADKRFFDALSGNL